jgi:hypothetical protein
LNRPSLFNGRNYHIAILEQNFVFGPLKTAGTARPITSLLVITLIAAIPGKIIDAKELLRTKIKELPTLSPAD